MRQRTRRMEIEIFFSELPKKIFYSHLLDLLLKVLIVFVESVQVHLMYIIKKGQILKWMKCLASTYSSTSLFKYCVMKGPLLLLRSWVAPSKSVSEIGDTRPKFYLMNCIQKGRQAGRKTLWLILAHYHQVPTSAALYWRIITQYQPEPPYTDLVQSSTNLHHIILHYIVREPIKNVLAEFVR